MKDFFKEYKWWLIIVFIAPLGVSYIWFMYDGFIPIGDIAIDSWLSFWGGFLAFYGTFFLGMVAIWQNKQADEQNRRLLDIENSRHSCNVILENSDSMSKHIRLSNETDVYNNVQCDISFNIINHGDAILNKVKLFFPDGQKFFSHLILAKGEKKNVIVKVPGGLDDKEKTEIFFISCNNVITYGDFNISFVGNDHAEMKHYHFYGLQKREAKQ